MMRLLTGIVVAGAVLWGGYWFIGERAVESGFKTWLNGNHGATSVKYESLNTTGFPNRFDTTITAPDVYDAQAGMGWSAPFVQIFALSYKPHHIIAVFPHTQTLTLGNLSVPVTSEDMRASLVVTPNTELALDRTRLAIEAPALELPFGRIEAARLFIATRRAVAEPDAHDFAVDLPDLLLPDNLRLELDPKGELPKRFEKIRVDATARFDDVLSLRQDAPALIGVEIRHSGAHWGNLSLSLEGELTADTAGYATGHLRLKAQNWRQVFAVLVTAKLVDPVWEGAIAPLANADGDPDNLDAPISLQNGLIYFGPLPMGQAPKLN